MNKNIAVHDITNLITYRHKMWGHSEEMACLSVVTMEKALEYAERWVRRAALGNELTFEVTETETTVHIGGKDLEWVKMRAATEADIEHAAERGNFNY